MQIYSLSDFHLSTNCPKPMNIFGKVWDNYIEDIKTNCSVINDEDILLIAGDLSWAMTLEQAQPDLEIIGSLKGCKIIIRGNHDYWWKSISAVRKVLPDGVYALQNDCIKFRNVIFTGSRGWTTPELGNELPADEEKIYNREIQRFKLGLESAIKLKEEGDKIIVMSHYPPFNSSFKPTPFTDMFSSYGVSAVVYGHLHGANVKVCKRNCIDGVCYYLTSCDLLANKPVKIEI